MNIIEFLKNSIDGKIDVNEQKRFLENKTEFSAEELASVVKVLIDKMPYTVKLEGAIDVCGTGGSGLDRINTSTISAFVLAACGVKVAKHGNKAASGRFGSFDLLEKLEVFFSGDVKEIENKFKNHNLAFLYARDFFSVMKYFADVRREIQRPTFFNLLGPLLNPANVKKQIIGTAFKENMVLIAEICKLLGREHVFVVCGEDGLDEISLTGGTHVVELKNGEINKYIVYPEEFGVCRCLFDEIKGGDGDFNTKKALEILYGNCETRHEDLVLINASLALILDGKAECFRDGYVLAKNVLKNGLAYEKFHDFKMPDFLFKIVNEKKITRNSIGKLKKSDRDFYKALKNNGMSVIAEIKRKSPSKGVICKGRFDPAVIAENYEKYGADAISVLCDKKYFGGDLKYMQKARESTKHTPILCKDFIIDEYQIYQARKYGADAILLIASMLTEDQINEFIDIAKSLGMDALCEAHTIGEFKMLLNTNAKIIGINNRNLADFKVDLNTTKNILDEISQSSLKDKLIVSESGIFSKEDIELLPKNVDAVLVGTSLMQGVKLSELRLKSIKFNQIKYE